MAHGQKEAESGIDADHQARLVARQATRRYRAIAQATIALLDDELKSSLLEAYRTMRQANAWLAAAVNEPNRHNQARPHVENARALIAQAHGKLLAVLGRDG